ncbi:protein ZNRD2 isoform X2 [Patella vulgata]|nr:protein ZNRD2 isoform X2 [Patella vulgata]XP_050407318.2 protein ZNRD2 isoform X2 [Patella vulgata]
MFDVHWVPPTEAEMKIIEARRERSNKISKLMGDYLLKGYKMLGITCRECETILLQDRHGSNYCVACSELDSDTDKDDPLKNQTAALTQVKEQQRVTSREETEFEDLPLQPDSQITDTELPPPAVVTNSQSVTSSNRTSNSGTSSIPSSDFIQSVTVLTNKLKWAVGELDKTASIEYTIQLCQLIKSCADAISSLQKTQS